jgi:hypothetical protein
LSIVVRGLLTPELLVTRGYSWAYGALPLSFVDPDLGALLTAAADAGRAEVDPDLGSLITTAADAGSAEVDADLGSLIIV